MAVDKSLMSGSMTMLLLRLLAEKDMYGYEMIDTLRKKSCNVFELKAGILVFGAIWLKNTHFKKTICAFKSAPFYNESIPFQRKDAL